MLLWTVSPSDDLVRPTLCSVWQSQIAAVVLSADAGIVLSAASGRVIRYSVLEPNPCPPLVSVLVAAWFPFVSDVLVDAVAGVFVSSGGFTLCTMCSPFEY